MTHPTPQELLEFIDGELSPEQQTQVAAHVHACDECNRQTASWRATRTALASWELPTRLQPATRLPRAARPRGRWRSAAAAAALVAAGFSLALMLAPGGGSSRSDAELASEVRRHVQEELHAELTRFAKSQESAHEELLTALNGRLDQLELQWLVDYAELRRDVETVAIGAEEGLRRLASAEASQEEAP
jgi:putative zinc finger protein